MLFIKLACTELEKSKCSLHIAVGYILDDILFIFLGHKEAGCMAAAGVTGKGTFRPGT